MASRHKYHHRTKLIVSVPHWMAEVLDESAQVNCRNRGQELESWILKLFPNGDPRVQSVEPYREPEAR